MAQDKQRLVMPPVKDSSSEPDAVALLMADHREVKALFAQYEALVARDAADEDRRVLAETICVLLTVHTTANEELFYPAAGSAIDVQDVVHDATVVHRRTRHLIADVMNMTPADPRFDGTVKALDKHVDQHVHERESGLFAKVRTSGLDLGSLGARLAERKRELMAEMEGEVEA